MKLSQRDFEEISKLFDDFVTECGVKTSCVPNTEMILVALCDKAESLIAGGGDKGFAVFLEFLLRIDEANQTNVIKIDDLKLVTERQN